MSSQYIKYTADSEWLYDGSDVIMTTGTLGDIYMSVSIETYGATELSITKTKSESLIVDDATFTLIAFHLK